MWTTISCLASPKFLVRLLTNSFLPQRFDSRLHGGNFFSHSVKSPLTTLQVCLSELEQLHTRDQNLLGKKYLKSAVMATKQINSLVQVATSRNPYEKVHAIRVAEFFHQFKTLVEYNVKNAELIFSIHLPNKNEVIKMNKYFFIELMQCLVNNALESYDQSCKQKMVFVTAIVKNKKLEIQVQDFGRGNNFLTSKFMATKGFTTKGQDHGFGLWFAKEVVEKQGRGKLRIYSEPNEGTIVKFSLPLN